MFSYQFATWLALWVPELGVNPKEWWYHITAVAGNSSQLRKQLCGMCMDCKQGSFHIDPQTISGQDDTSKLKMVGIDMNLKNLDTVRAVESRLASSNSLWSSRVELNMIHSAVSNYTGVTRTRKCSAGEESCSITSMKLKNQMSDILRIETVDSIVEKLGQKGLTDKVTGVDILLIDTEGYDPLVVEGASKTLRSGLVRCLIFEYHYRAHWRRISLQHVTETLEQYNYSCYLSVMGLLWPVNQGRLHVFTITLY